jgi:hypothetical protein
MTQSDNAAIQKFGDELTAQFRQLAEKSPIDRVGIYSALIVLQANLCRVQTQAIVESMNRATVVSDAEAIARGEA